MTKRVDDTIEGVVQWFGHEERMERDLIANRVYVGECAGSRSEGRTRKRRTDTVKECLRKKGLDVRRARRMVGECMGHRGGFQISFPILGKRNGKQSLGWKRTRDRPPY